MSRSGRPGGECMAGGACLGSDGFAPRGKLGDMGPRGKLCEVAQRFFDVSLQHVCEGCRSGNLRLRPSTCAPDRRKGGNERFSTIHSSPPKASTSSWMGTEWRLRPQRTRSTRGTRCRLVHVWLMCPRTWVLLSRV
eukprot:scaffold39809_cov63-Phaeocystis_antarctica.AAC.3